MEIAFIMNMGGLGIILLFLSLAYLLLWIYCLVNVIQSNFKDPNMKLIWIVILLFAHGLGPLVYLIIGKNTKI